MKVVAIINVGAGAGRSSDADMFRSSLQEAFRRNGIEAEFKFVAGEKVRFAAETARSAAQQNKIDAIVVGGGDGSVRTVAAVLAGTDVPIGVLPLGTLNHFAKDLNVPMSIEGAVDVIAHSNSRLVDLAEVNGEIFVNNSSVGIYPHMVLDRERKSRLHGLSKWTAMLLATLRVLRIWPIRSLWLSAEGRTTPYRTPCLFVGNNAYNRSIVGRRDALDDGELWVSIATGQSRVAFVTLVIRTILGLSNQNDLQALSLSSVEVRSRAGRLLVAMDGEVNVMRPPLLYRSMPRSLRVFTPRPVDT